MTKQPETDHPVHELIASRWWNEARRAPSKPGHCTRGGGADQFVARLLIGVDAADHENGQDRRGDGNHVGRQRDLTGGDERVDLLRVGVCGCPIRGVSRFRDEESTPWVRFRRSRYETPACRPGLGS